MLGPEKKTASPLGTLRLLACVLTVSFAAGCGDACLTLAEQVCVCLPDDGTRAACNQRAKEDEASFPIRPTDQAFCQQKLDAKVCDCTKLNTPEGKLNCGLVYTLPQ